MAMNRFQELWWQQAKSDHDAFVLLRSQGIAQCHLLHYLQMASEKLAKAYFWRDVKPPPMKHAGFVNFLKFLGQIQRKNQARIANLFAFKRYDDFQNWIRAVLWIAYDLEHLAPTLANNGPNPEYPWPHELPEFAPVNHNFVVWTALTSGQGRDLMRVFQIAVSRFPEYADA